MFIQTRLQSAWTPRTVDISDISYYRPEIATVSNIDPELFSEDYALNKYKTKFSSWTRGTHSKQTNLDIGYIYHDVPILFHYISSVLVRWSIYKYYID